MRLKLEQRLKNIECFKSNWGYITNHPHRIVIIGGSRSCKTNVLLNVIKHQQPVVEKF